MAHKSLAIIANPGTKRLLGQLGSPVVNVAIRGRVNESKAGTALIIDQVATDRSSTLPIIASASTKKALGELAKSKGSHAVTLVGHVQSAGGRNVLVLNRVQQALTIAADSATQGLLSELAGKGEGEVTVTAKLESHGGRKALVLKSEGGKKKK